MRSPGNWLLLILCSLALIGLLTYARGPKHHHGDEIGSHGTKVVVVYQVP